MIGTVGRLEPIKNQPLLADAFVLLLQNNPRGAERLRLAIVGDGPLMNTVREKLAAAGLESRLWLPGARRDIPDILRAMDCFCLPSLAEGTSCTLQEAMATALPIVVTDVGGNANLLVQGRYGRLVPSGDPDALADALSEVFACGEPGSAGALNLIREHYGLPAVLRRYSSLFGRE